MNAECTALCLRTIIPLNRNKKLRNRQLFQLSSPLFIVYCFAQMWQPSAAVVVAKCPISSRIRRAQGNSQRKKMLRSHSERRHIVEEDDFRAHTARSPLPNSESLCVLILLLRPRLQSTICIRLTIYIQSGRKRSPKNVAKCEWKWPFLSPSSFTFKPRMEGETRVQSNARFVGLCVRRTLIENG